jgi:hypothetical protein
VCLLICCVAINKIIFLTALIIFVYEPDCTKFRQRIGFSTQNNTILWNQVRTKILPALKRLQAVKQIILFIATQQINKHTDQLISVNA